MHGNLVVLVIAMGLFTMPVRVDGNDGVDGDDGDVGDDGDNGDDNIHHARVELELCHLLCGGSVHRGLGEKHVSDLKSITRYSLNELSVESVK